MRADLFCVISSRERRKPKKDLRITVPPVMLVRLSFPSKVVGVVAGTATYSRDGVQSRVSADAEV